MERVGRSHGRARVVRTDAVGGDRRRRHRRVARGPISRLAHAPARAQRGHGGGGGRAGHRPRLGEHGTRQEPAALRPEHRGVAPGPGRAGKKYPADRSRRRLPALAGRPRPPQHPPSDHRPAVCGGARPRRFPRAADRARPQRRSGRDRQRGLERPGAHRGRGGARGPAHRRAEPAQRPLVARRARALARPHPPGRRQPPLLSSGRRGAGEDGNVARARAESDRSRCGRTPLADGPRSPGFPSRRRPAACPGFPGPVRSRRGPGAVRGRSGRRARTVRPDRPGAARRGAHAGPWRHLAQRHRHGAVGAGCGPPRRVRPRRPAPVAGDPRRAHRGAAGDGPGGAPPGLRDRLPPRGQAGALDRAQPVPASRRHDDREPRPPPGASRSSTSGAARRRCWGW